MRERGGELGEEREGESDRGLTQTLSFMRAAKTGREKGRKEDLKQLDIYDRRIVKGGFLGH